MRTFLLLLAAMVMCNVAEARPRRNYTYTTPNSTTPAKTYAYTTALSNAGDDQTRCQQEADYMAAHGIAGHVGSCIGNFEGVGCGSSPNCQTCTPSRPMTNTGDASAQGRNGLWYRVRSWR